MSRHTCIYRVLAGLVAGLLAAGSAWAQQTLGGITGSVMDANGGILAGATATVLGEQTGLKRTQVSGSDGYYSFSTCRSVLTRLR